MPGQMDQARQPSSASESQRGYPISRRRWAIAEGNVPSWSNGAEPELSSHDATCLLNAGVEDARFGITDYFENPEPAYASDE
jgi:hypothetical protein